MAHEDHSHEDHSSGVIEDRGTLHLGAGLLQRLLAADTGHHGPRIDCGQGHQAEFVAHRVKNIDTVLGRVAVRRAYYALVATGSCRATTSSA